MTGSGRPVITMVHSAEPVVRNDATQSYGANPAVRCSLPESEMRTVLVVVTNILREQPLQMLFIHCNDVIQQVSSAAFDPALCHAVLPGTLEEGPHRTHLQRSNGHGYFQSIFPIPVKDQESRSRPKRKCLPQLLDDPRLVGCFVTLKCRIRRRSWPMTKKQ